MSVPTEETGHPGGYSLSLTPTGKKTYAVESPTTWAPELRFPDSIVVFEAMSYETHLSGVLEAISQPILGAEWHLEGEGVPENVMEFVRTELGLPSEENPLSRTHHAGIVLHDHLEEMVETMLWAGFACAEIVYNVAPPTPAQSGLGLPDEVRHLRKLAPRPPRTITRIETEDDGGLRGIRQTPLEYEVTQGVEDTFIPVEALVFYCHKRRGGHWAGTSVLRPAYRPWALKDIYLRLDAQAVDKHSSGYWHATSTDKTRAQVLFDELTEMRSGDRGVIVTDQLDNVNLLGLNGSLIDITPRLKYLDQEMSRSALAMFLDLGHDAGARSLGETYIQVFYTKVAAVAKYIARVVTEHIIRDLVRHNFPDGTPYPELDPGDIIAQQGASADTIKALMDAKAITYDRGLEEYLRGRYGIPDLPAPEEGEDDDDTALDRQLQEAQLRAVNTTAAATAYRTGYAPESISDAYNLPPGLKHTGFYPVTVKTEDAIESEAGPRSIAASEDTTAARVAAMRRATRAYEELRARMGEPVG